MVKKAEIFLEYQPYFDFPQQNQGNLYAQACSNDDTTVRSWRKTWVKQISENKKRFGAFKDLGVGKLFGKHEYSPCIVAGSGPSLKENAEILKQNRGMPVVSCLHNFHYFEDRDIKIDYYVTLDAGPVTIEEVSEGGTNSEEWYWNRTKDKVLVAYVGTCPELLNKWQGEVLFYNCSIPNAEVEEEIEAIEKFRSTFSTGGNVLGASLYLAKAVLGCNPIAFIGANFAFSYSEKFHGWDSKYDEKLGNCIRATDVYGNKVKTWQSYYNFKAWFDVIVQRCPGIWFNCTEGGTFGSYPEGNIRDLKQMDLADFFEMYHVHDHVREVITNPESDLKKILF